MAGRRVVVTVAALGVAAFAAGWAGGRTTGFRDALGEVRQLRRYAECRGAEGSEWVYPGGHPEEGEPLARGADEPPREGVGPDWREYLFKHRRLFGGVPLMETIEFDVAERLPRRYAPPGSPHWWERPRTGPGYEEIEARLRREHERALRQREALRWLRRGLFGGLRVDARMRGAPDASKNPLLTVEVENTALAPREVCALFLTYRYQTPLVEALPGPNTPRAPLEGRAGDGEPPRTVAPGATLTWSKRLGEMAGVLEERGMRLWPDARLMRLDDPVSERLARSGRLGLRVVNLLRGLTFWDIAVTVVDERGGSRKAEVRLEPPWAGEEEGAA